MAELIVPLHDYDTRTATLTDNNIWDTYSERV